MCYGIEAVQSVINSKCDKICDAVYLISPDFSKTSKNLQKCKMSKISKFYPSKTVYFHLDMRARAKQMTQGFYFRKTIKISKKNDSKNPRSRS